MKVFPLSIPQRSILLALFLFFLASSGPLGAAERAQVIAVLDGDTIVLKGGQKVRYLGIDAPELGKEGRPDEFLAREAFETNRRWVLNQNVLLVFGPEKEDRYHRRLAYVFLESGLFVNSELVKRGLAHVLYQGPDLERWEELLRLQQEAIKAKRGIWERALQESETFYQGNGRTRKLHRPGCPLAALIGKANVVRFSSKKEAYLKGFSPCRNCKP